MDFTALVDVAIGLSLVYLGVSLYVTIVNEIIAQKLQLRGKQLAADLTKLIDDSNSKEMLAANPALAPFLKSDGKLGSFVDPEVVARLLIGAARAGQTTVATMADIVTAIDALPPSGLKTQLQALAKAGSDDVEQFIGTVGHWIDQSLTMMGEVYKQRIKAISFGIGLAAAVVFNIDSLSIATHLYQDKEARRAIVAVAEQFTDTTSKQAFDTCIALDAEARAKNESCKPIRGLVGAVSNGNETFGELPIFWSTGDTWRNFVPFMAADGNWGWIIHWVGWLITALAVSLGAPFWFDLLNKLVNIRRGAVARGAASSG